MSLLATRFSRVCRSAVAFALPRPCQSLGVIRKPDGEKEDRRDDAVIEARSAAWPEQLRLDRQGERHQCSDPDDEHHGVANLRPRIEFEQRLLEGVPKKLERIGAGDSDASKLAAERRSL